MGVPVRGGVVAWGERTTGPKNIRSEHSGDHTHTRSLSYIVKLTWTDHCNYSSETCRSMNGPSCDAGQKDFIVHFHLAEHLS